MGLFFPYLAGIDDDRRKKGENKRRIVNPARTHIAHVYAHVSATACYMKVASRFHLDSLQEAQLKPPSSFFFLISIYKTLFTSLPNPISCCLISLIAECETHAGFVSQGDTGGGYCGFEAALFRCSVGLNPGDQPHENKPLQLTSHPFRSRVERTVCLVYTLTCSVSIPQSLR